MARIRTIKPEFWASEQVSELSLQARLVFIGLWNFCDDAGVFPASFKNLRSEIFPADDKITDLNVASWVDELIKNILVYEYQAKGRPYWWVIKFKDHQKIDKPTYRFPLPTEEEIKNVLKESDKLYYRSLNSCRIVAERSSTEWKGKESNGKESKGDKNTLLLRSI
jgi:hypothetical protein